MSSPLMKTIPVREAVGTILCHDIGNLRDLLAALTIPVLIITHAPEDVDVFADALVLYENVRARGGSLNCLFFMIFQQGKNQENPKMPSFIGIRGFFCLMILAQLSDQATCGGRHSRPEIHRRQEIVPKMTEKKRPNGL